ATDRELGHGVVGIDRIFLGGEVAEELARREHVEQHVLASEGVVQQLDLPGGDDVEESRRLAAVGDRLAGDETLLAETLVGRGNGLGRKGGEEGEPAEDLQAQVDGAGCGGDYLDFYGGTAAIVGHPSSPVRRRSQRSSQRGRRSCRHRARASRAGRL